MNSMTGAPLTSARRRPWSNALRLPSALIPVSAPTGPPTPPPAPATAEAVFTGSAGGWIVV